MQKANLVELAQFATPADQKAAIFEKLSAHLEGFHITSSRVLVAVHVEPEKSKGGILMPQKRIDESRYQGKAALVLKMGPTAFKYDGAYPWEGRVPEIGEWVFHRVSDGWDLDLKGVACRLIESDMVMGIVADPMLIY